ncbi:hypothetical protein LOTGIDRAFT_234302 [Lottia gigantea]|uniref:Uncharacterized protein n=1 Tax=Lottia gigantea TaxID=225164 RepID=V4BLE8_LOTGI|nr:hypothetical protein LOTGIDRAFT_234302 [Lottia gigantea]ESO89459.1 hypothetical protein LOTGIDRAFT_234302 [Lottia gigantea]
MANKSEAYSTDNPGYKGDQGQPQQGYPQQGYPQQGYPQQQGYPMQQYPAGTNVVIGQPATTIVTNPRPNDYFTFALLTCLCCFWPTGIAALVFSCNSRDASDRLDFNQAQNDGRMAKIFSIISLVIGLVWIIAVIIYAIVAATVVTKAYTRTYYG